MIGERVKKDYQYWYSLCSGATVHHICIITVGEFRSILAKNERKMPAQKALFHNKYYMELDHTVMDCMEERLVAINKREYKKDCIDLVH